MDNCVKLKDYLSFSKIKKNEKICIVSDCPFKTFTTTIERLPECYRNKLVDYVNAELSFGSTGITPMITIHLVHEETYEWR